MGARSLERATMNRQETWGGGGGGVFQFPRSHDSRPPSLLPERDYKQSAQVSVVSEVSISLKKRENTNEKLKQRTEKHERKS